MSKSGKKVKLITRRESFEKRVFDAMGIQGQDSKITFQRIGCHPNTVENMKTRVFKRFLVDLDRMIDLYSVFEKRFEEHKEAYTKLRRLARKVNKEK